MKLRGAISGFGQMAERGHLPGWRGSSASQIVAVHEPAAARRQAALRAFDGKIRVYEDLELMLDGERLDFIDIASPPVYHASAVRRALAASVHVLVEKPLCLPDQKPAELYAMAEARQRVLFTVHNWKYSPAYRCAYELIASGRLGQVRYCAMRRLRSTHAGGAAWRLDPDVGGGGILIDHGWHVFYLTQWLMGADPRKVAARFQGTGAVEEVADLSLEYAGGGIGYIHLSWRAPIRETSALIYGEQGMIEIREGGVRLLERSGAQTEFPVSDAADDSYHSTWFDGLVAQFEATIEAGPGSASAAENRREAENAMALLEAARQSAASGGVPQGIGN